jgi:hypothetical protein
MTVYHRSIAVGKTIVEKKHEFPSMTVDQVRTKALPLSLSLYRPCLQCGCARWSSQPSAALPHARVLTLCLSCNAFSRWAW